MKVIDLFAGMGGWDLAARELGLRPHSIEWDPIITATNNAAGGDCITADVSSVPLEGLKCDLLIASPPCQSFSMAGKRAGLSDPRGQLVWEPLRWIKALRPDYVALEQVPPVLPIWREYGAILQELGYCSWAGILQAEAYGVPQTRKRAIFMARRDKNGVFPPAPTHSKYYSHNPTKLDEGVLPWISMAEALGWVGAEHPAPTLALSGSTSPIGGSGSRAAWEVRTRGASERPNDIFSADAPARTVTHSVDYWETRPASTIVTTRRSKDGIIVGRQLPEGEQSNPERGWTARRPSTTIVGSFSPDIVAPPTYRKAGDGPRQNQKGGVKITLQQALILQGFPPDYPVMGKKTKQFLQVGNAIPPPLALAILKALIVKK